LIASLFEAGHSFFVPPLKIVYLKTKLTSHSPVQLLISVPKRNFPKAHDRNRIKRLIREAYRKQKHGLYASLAKTNSQLALAIIYTSKKITTFNEAESKIKLALSRLSQDAGNQ
jgi:ribonuclease P protein component